MSTVVSTYALRRQRTFEMFDDLTDSPWTFSGNDQTGVFTFDADLDETTRAAIRARIESRDEADLAARAELAELALECETWLAGHVSDPSAEALAMRAVVALYRYTLDLPTTDQET